jgi:hypothetical protein
VNARLARLLTAAHAPHWRRRYGSEFRALLEDLPACPGVLVSALTSALGTHARSLAVLGGAALAAILVFFAAAASDRPAGWTAFLPPAGRLICKHNVLASLAAPLGVHCRRSG